MITSPFMPPPLLPATGTGFEINPRDRTNPKTGGQIFPTETMGWLTGKAITILLIIFRLPLFIPARVGTYEVERKSFVLAPVDPKESTVANVRKVDYANSKRCFSDLTPIWPPRRLEMHFETSLHRLAMVVQSSSTKSRW
jgi:hypothetical protein